ncbi:MAG: SDR family NAD(P)-dependent oxidoreductase, partial [Alphaproteobacteria bacterium]|nr:SDR family NAD(P)-dependent oxidoreductase [Alphaproteobacteria bacterium]
MVIRVGIPEKRIALVTGAGRGIGAATALWLARHGYRVALAARTLSEVESVVREIESEQGAGTSLALVLDVSDPKQVASAFDRIESQWGQVRVLVNNAAALIRGEVATMPLEDFDRT